MNKEDFIRRYPARRPDSSKFDNGRILLVSGSYGMAGAAILNIIGARSVGSSYIRCLLPASIYPIVAAREVTTVYHPDPLDDPDFLPSLDVLGKVDAIAFGSGLDLHPYRKEYLAYILRDFSGPVVVDAAAFRLFAEDESLYGNSNIIMTPHLGEFAVLTGKSRSEILDDREAIARDFASKHNVTLVLKGPGTIVTDGGRLYKNDSGNEALARAGSGDVLTGMICGLCSLYDDSFQAAIDGVWMHGYLCDETVKVHAKETFDLCHYVEYADVFFKQKDHF